MSQLTDALYLLYAHDDSDTAQITRRLTERRRATWINTLTDLARQHGCSRYAGTPKSADAKELARQSKADAISISKTYNRDLRREIERLYKANPRGNRTYYSSNLRQWITARDTWKVYQIGLNTDSTARQYAQRRFYEMNRTLGKRFVASGPPPVCKVCVRLFAAGIVDFAYTLRHGLPAHIGCPHTWRVTAPAKANCEQLWLG